MESVNPDVQEGVVVALVRGSPHMRPEEVMPNAYLLAAALDLLAALEEAYQQMRRDDPPGEESPLRSKAILMAEAAMAKAKSYR